jgi:predicted RNA-binding Zn ribbon-like protein
MGELRESERQRLAGGELCLDFANTVNGHTHLPHHEYIHDYLDLVLWGRHAGVLNSNDTEALLRKAQVDPLGAEAVYQQGLELRETIYRIFSALAAGAHADSSDLDWLTAVWKIQISHSRLVRFSGGFDLGWDDEPCLERPLRAVTESTIRLLTSSQMHLVRQCAGEGCDWLFVDASHNHFRKWCSMEECGNRAKMKRRKLKLALNTTLDTRV